MHTEAMEDETSSSDESVDAVSSSGNSDISDDEEIINEVDFGNSANGIRTLNVYPRSRKLV